MDLYVLILSSFKDSLEASLMDFLEILHSLSYQGLVILLFFLQETSKENLLIEVERVLGMCYILFMGVCGCIRYDNCV